MTTGDTLLKLLIAGLLGLTGQGLRVVVGLKKINDVAQQQGQKPTDLIEPDTLLISLLIGFVAGVLAGFSISAFGDGTNLTKANIFALIGAGYAGTDFIEGFMRRALPDTSQQTAGGIDPPKGTVNQPR